MIDTASGPTINRANSRQDWATPWQFIHAAEKKTGGYKVLFDLAASKENSKAAHFFSEQEDSLKQDWHKLLTEKRGWLWLNPPFDNIAPWASKCAEESDKGAWIMMLTPASVGSNWFRDHVNRKAMIYALNGRITFIGAEDPYPKDCILSVYYPAKTIYSMAGFGVWTWGKELDNTMQDPFF